MVQRQRTERVLKVDNLRLAAELLSFDKLRKYQVVWFASLGSLWNLKTIHLLIEWRWKAETINDLHPAFNQSPENFVKANNMTTPVDAML